MLTAMLLAAGLAADGATRPERIEPPTDAQVLRSLPKAEKVFRDDLVIVKNKLVETTTPNVKLVSGETVAVVQQHWECVAYWKETTKAGDITTNKARVQVVYLDTHQVVK